MSQQITPQHLAGHLKELERQRDHYASRCASLAGELEHRASVIKLRDARIAELEKQIRDEGGKPVLVEADPKPLAPADGEAAVTH